MSNETSQAILSALSVTKSFGAQPVLQDVSLTIHDGDRIGLIGRNGCGKSTLIKILAGLDTPDDGLVTRRLGLRISLLSQQCMLNTDLTVRDIMEDAGRELRSMVTEYEEIMARLAVVPHDTPEHDLLAERTTAMHHTLELAGAWDVEQEVKRISVALRLPPSERILSTLSGGELRRVDMAARLIAHPDVLMLDEPTNQIDWRSVEWIEGYLERYTGSCVLITHDRYFLDRVVNRIVEIESNRLYSFPGNYERFLELKTALEQVEARTESNRQSLLRRELAWLRRGAKARSTKQKARIQRYYEVEAQGPPPPRPEGGFEIPRPRRLGRRILEINHVTHGYGQTTLIRDLSLIVTPKMRIGIIGPNGCGKTTLLRILMGTESPWEGEIVPGDNTDFLYVDQSHDDVDPAKTILDFVSGGQMHWEINGKRMFVPAYLERFLFDIATVRVPMGNLSGGERNRVDIAKKLLRGGNFLVLDEPTNDLDLTTLRLLEEAIEDFDGCSLIVSHDRYFLNRLCTHILACEGDGNWVLVAGAYDDYVLYRERKEAEAKAAALAAQPPAQQKKASAAQSKLTWAEKNELKGMEKAILEAEARVVALETEMTSPAFYQQSPEAIKHALAQFETEHKKVSQLYARWEELEAK